MSGLYACPLSPYNLSLLDRVCHRLAITCMVMLMLIAVDAADVAAAGVDPHPQHLHHQDPHHRPHHPQPHTPLRTKEGCRALTETTGGPED